MRKFIAALLTAALCIGVFGIVSADAQSRYRLRTKSAGFVTWGPTGPSGAKQDTSQTIFSGANDVDTTAAIDISDFAWELVGAAQGGAASVVQNGLKVWVIGDGAMDAVDSLYYAIEHSPDGVHWVRQDGLIAAGSVAWIGAVAGQDQDGNTAVIANNAVSFNVVVDADRVSGVATQVATLGDWWLAPFVRFHILTDDTAGNLIGACRVLVTYVAHEPS